MMRNFPPNTIVTTILCNARSVTGPVLWLGGGDGIYSNPIQHTVFLFGSVTAAVSSALVGSRLAVGCWMVVDDGVG